MAALVLCGCGDEGGSEQACWEEQRPSSVSHPASAVRLAQTNITESYDYIDKGGAASRTITAAFLDTTYAEMVSRAPAPLCDLACVGLTGAPYEKCKVDGKDPCTVESLDAEGVQVELASGAAALERTATGRFTLLDAAAPLYSELPVKVSVTGKDQSGFFPSYDQQLEPPTALELSSPDPASSAPVGTSDLKLSWTPGNGDLVLVELKKASDTVTDKVQCVLQDDGCHHVGACVLDWLEVKQGESFDLSVSRVRATLTTMGADTSAVLKLTTRVKTRLVR